MLRECHRVLRPGGRLALVVIHTAPGLSEADRRRAAELGPSEVRASAAPEELAAMAGFEHVAVQDVTPDFELLCRAILNARAEAEVDLRAEEGDEAYEIERGKKEHMLAGVSEGLLRRSIVSARRPSGRLRPRPISQETVGGAPVSGIRRPA